MHSAENTLFNIVKNGLQLQKGSAVLRKTCGVSEGAGPAEQSARARYSRRDPHVKAEESPRKINLG